jgi:hypothetical protein
VTVAVDTGCATLLNNAFFGLVMYVCSTLKNDEQHSVIMFLFLISLQESFKFESLDLSPS